MINQQRVEKPENKVDKKILRQRILYYEKSTGYWLAIILQKSTLQSLR